jgi:peptide chain release factor 2
MRKKLGGFFDIDGKISQAKILEEKMSVSDFWNNQEESKKTINEVKVLKSWIEPWGKLNKHLNDTEELLALSAESGETGLLAELKTSLEQVKRDLAQIEIRKKLGGENDLRNAIVSINAGAGGTESCDWADMLLRMYSKWSDSKGYQSFIVDILAGEEAGIKNVTFMVRGEYAYGYMKAERGVHRLVRISPFDANKRRHTSFASVDVIPEVDDSIDIQIEEKDIRIDTYRAGGAGGQHVNKTESAVRITHLPTKIVVQCQNERSQFQNKETAMKLLRARLYEFYQRQRDAKLKKEYGEKAQIAWGSQIRSYVLHPYSMVKDHRTDYETSNSIGVLDGDLDGFIEAYLKSVV